MKKRVNSARMLSSKKTKSNNALRFAMRKGTTVLAVLFCLSFNIAQAADNAIVVINNAALKAGESMTIQAYKVNGNTERLISGSAVGPVVADCGNGCGSEPIALGDGPGVYKIVINGSAAASTTTINFTSRPGEQYVWMVSNRTTPPTIRLRAPEMQMVADASPYRIDLSTYTKSKVVAPAPVQAPKKKSSFWPFSPKTRHAPQNN